LKKTARLSKRIVASYPPQELAEDVVEALVAYTKAAAARLPNCSFYPNIMEPDYEALLMQTVDEGEWTSQFGHETQDFGWKYSRGKNEFTEEDHLGPLPDWLAHIAETLVEWGDFREAPDECFINSYRASQGLNPHRDCVCFQDRIATVTLNSGAMLRFTPPNWHKVHFRPVDLYLPRRSLFVFWGESRRSWFHEVPGTPVDRVEGVGDIRRTRRVSLTFRNAKPPASRAASQTRFVGRRPPNWQTGGG